VVEGSSPVTASYVTSRRSHSCVWDVKHSSVQARHLHHVAAHKDVIYEVLGGGSSPTQEVRAIQTVSQPGKQVHLKVEA
jgi:hypothetical protein